MTAVFDLDHEKLASDPRFAEIGSALAAFSPIDSEETFDRYCREACRRICVTLAEEGAALWERGKLVTAPAPRIAVKDTVGAEDAFMAGLMVGLTRGVDTHKVLENACRLGAYVASHNGATPLLPPEITAAFKIT